MFVYMCVQVMYMHVATESGYGVEEGEGGDLFSGAKEMETWQESVAVKKAIHVQLGRRSGPRWSLPPQSLGMFSTEYSMSRECPIPPQPST